MGKELNKDIFMLYRWGMMVVPIMLMAAHWCGVLYYHCLGMTNGANAGGLETAVMYAMAYIAPMVLMLPASYFFKLCWIWRIPFAYLAGVNIIRLFYGSWTITEAMKQADYTLIFITIGLYWAAMTANSEK